MADADAAHPRWPCLFAVQLAALVWKNVLLAARNWRATLTQLAAPLLFVLVIFVVDVGVRASRQRQPAFRDVRRSDNVPVTPIPDCRHDVFTMKGSDNACLDFAYAPGGNVHADLIATAIAANNGNRPVPATQYRGFPDEAAIDAYLLAHPNEVLGAVIFHIGDDSIASKDNTEPPPPFPIPTTIDFTLQTNSSVKFWRGEFRDPNTYVQVPLQVATEREIVRYLGNQARRSLGAAEDDTLDLDWNVGLRTFPHPAAVAPSIVGGIAPGFLFAATMFSFVLVASNVVHERELQLRQGMESMGLLLSSYWCSWIVWEGTMNVVSSGIITAAGYLLGFPLFVKNSQGLLFLLFFVFQCAMLAFALLLSVFTSTSQGATSLSFGVFIVGWIFQSTVLFGFPYQAQYKSDALRVIFNLLPWNPFTKAITDLGAATATIKSDGPGFGITWENRFAYCVPPRRDSAPPPLGFEDAGGDSSSAAGPGSAAANTRPSSLLTGGTPMSATEDFISAGCTLSVGGAIVWMAVMFFVFACLAAYCDQVVPNSYGTRRPFYYFLLPSYWFARRRRGASSCLGRGGGGADEQEAPPQHQNQRRSRTAQRAICGALDAANDSSDVDEDVHAEEHAARSRARAWLDDGDTAADGIELFGLSKKYVLPPVRDDSLRDPVEDAQGGVASSSHHNTWLRSIGAAFLRWFPCCTRRKRQVKVAVAGTWLRLESGQVFALLGPNGAGKTTTIHMLTGLVAPTRGDAVVLGESLVSPGGVDRVRQTTGVCPQFDILWGELSGIEHMRLFYAIKGLWANSWSQEHSSRALLERVKLSDAATRRTETYSGGMKRRLSVAIAMLGSPPVVYLDEPTTGMDPISRRYVWGIINEYKRHAAVVLTTHSMEEADVLGDRIGIMARGSLQVLGTSLHLKNRFGAGYRVSVALAAAKPGEERGALAKRKARLLELIESHIDVDEVASGNEGTLADVPLEDEGRRSSLSTSRSAAARFSAESSRSARGRGPPPPRYGVYQNFVVPREHKDSLPGLLADLDAARERLGVVDVQISLSPLEEVFLSITATH